MRCLMLFWDWVLGVLLQDPHYTVGYRVASQPLPIFSSSFQDAAWTPGELRRHQESVCAWPVVLAIETRICCPDRRLWNYLMYMWNNPKEPNTNRQDSDIIRWELKMWALLLLCLFPMQVLTNRKILRLHVLELFILKVSKQTQK